MKFCHLKIVRGAMDARKWSARCLRLLLVSNYSVKPLFVLTNFVISNIVRRAGSDSSMSASGSAGPGFDAQWGCKF